MANMKDTMNNLNTTSLVNRENIVANKQRVSRLEIFMSLSWFSVDHRRLLVYHIEGYEDKALTEKKTVEAPMYECDHIRQE